LYKVLVIFVVEGRECDPLNQSVATPLSNRTRFAPQLFKLCVTDSPQPGWLIPLAFAGFVLPISPWKI